MYIVVPRVLPTLLFCFCTIDAVTILSQDLNNVHALGYFSAAAVCRELLVLYNSVQLLLGYGAAYAHYCSDFKNVFFKHNICVCVRVRVSDASEHFKTVARVFMSHPI